MTFSAGTVDAANGLSVTATFSAAGAQYWWVAYETASATAPADKAAIVALVGAGVAGNVKAVGTGTASGTTAALTKSDLTSGQYTVYLYAEQGGQNTGITDTDVGTPSVSVTVDFAANSGKFFNLTTGVPVGSIVTVDQEVTYKPGSEALKAALPTLEMLNGKSASNYYIKTITYKTATAECEGAPGDAGLTHTNGEVSGGNSWNLGVKKLKTGTADDYSAYVACVYDVLVEVATKDTRTKVGEASYKFAVGRKNLELSMWDRLDLTESEAVYNGQVKNPRVMLKDGSYVLQQEFGTAIRGDYKIIHPEDAARRDAGTATISVEATNGNYSGTLTRTYTIEKRELDFDPFFTYGYTKPYDGTDTVTVDPATQPIRFIGYPVGDDPASSASALGAADYAIRAGTLKYDGKDAGDDRKVRATVTLSTDPASPARNYKLKTTAFEASNQRITKAVPTSDHLAATWGSPVRTLDPEGENEDWYNGSEKTFTAALKSGFSKSGRITVVYDTDDGKPPVAPGSYVISARVAEGGANFAASGTEDIKLGTLTIVEGRNPTISGYVPTLSMDTSYYATKSVTIKVFGAVPEGGRGSLTYRWFKVVEGDTVALTAGGGNELTLSGTVPGVTTYQAMVTYSGPEQQPKSIMSEPITVTVLPAPVSIEGAVIRAEGRYEYTGSKIVPEFGAFTVTMGQTPLTEGADYKVKSIANNVNAGQDAALVTIEGINAWKGTAVGTFTIEKAQINLDSLVIGYSVAYSGAEQPIKVSARTGPAGLGAVTASYDPDDVPRLGAGSWDVTLSIADGANYLGMETLPLTQKYTIRKAIFDTSMIVKPGLPKEVPFNGANQGIAVPEKRGIAANYTGTLKVAYERNGVETDTAAAVGRYTVKLKVGGDDNFNAYELNLGSLTIYDPTSVASGDREIPAGAAFGQGAVAPVKALTSAVTVGPSPVKAGGTVSFYWNGSKPVSGKLAVYGATGAKAASVKVSGTGRIGEWSAKNAAEGTYLVKGVLTEKNGGKVRVSAQVGVSK